MRFNPLPEFFSHNVTDPVINHSSSQFFWDGKTYPLGSLDNPKLVGFSIFTGRPIQLISTTFFLPFCIQPCSLLLSSTAKQFAQFCPQRHFVIVKLYSHQIFTLFSLSFSSFDTARMDTVTNYSLKYVYTLGNARGSLAMGKCKGILSNKPEL